MIDRVPESYKSELVNEELRKVFKEKGLLDEVSVLFILMQHNCDYIAFNVDKKQRRTFIYQGFFFVFEYDKLINTTY